MSNTIAWYFDFISPFAYLQQIRLQKFSSDIMIQSCPILFAGLLNYWEHKGPAEIPSKRLFVITKIFKYIWHDGLSVDDDASWYKFVSSLGINEPGKLINQNLVKGQLRKNTKTAIEVGVFGVPTIIADGHLFWGNDATDMYLDYQKSSDFYADPQLKFIDTIPEAASRR